MIPIYTKNNYVKKRILTKPKYLYDSHYIKNLKSVLTNLKYFYNPFILKNNNHIKNLTQFFAYSFFQILKKYIYKS